MTPSTKYCQAIYCIATSSSSSYRPPVLAESFGPTLGDRTPTYAAACPRNPPSRGGSFSPAPARSGERQAPGFEHHFPYPLSHSLLPLLADLMRRVDVVLHELFSHALDKFIDPNSVVVDPLLCGKSGLDMRVCEVCQNTTSAHWLRLHTCFNVRCLPSTLIRAPTCKSQHSNGPVRPSM